MSPYRIFTSLTLATLLSSYAFPVFSNGKDEDPEWVEPDLAAEDAKARAAYEKRIAYSEAMANTVVLDPALETALEASLQPPYLPGTPLVTSASAGASDQQKKKQHVSFAQGKSLEKTRVQIIPEGLKPSANQKPFEFAQQLMDQYALSPEAALRYVNTYLRTQALEAGESQYSPIQLYDIMTEIYDMCRAVDNFAYFMETEGTEEGALRALNDELEEWQPPFDQTDLQTIRSFLDAKQKRPEKDFITLWRDASPYFPKANYTRIADACITAYDSAFEVTRNAILALQVVNSSRKEIKKVTGIRIPQDISLADIEPYRAILKARKAELKARKAEKEQEAQERAARVRAAQAAQTAREAEIQREDQKALEAFQQHLAKLSGDEASRVIIYVNQLALRNATEIPGFTTRDYEPLLQLILGIDPEHRENILIHTVAILATAQSLNGTHEFSTCIETLKRFPTAEKRGMFVADLQHIADIANLPLSFLESTVMENLFETKDYGSMIKTITPAIKGQKDANYIGLLLYCMNDISDSAAQEEFVQNFMPFVKMMEAPKRRGDIEVDLGRILNTYISKEALPHQQELAELMPEYVRTGNFEEMEDIVGMMEHFCTQLQSRKSVAELKGEIEKRDTETDPQLLRARQKCFEILSEKNLSKKETYKLYTRLDKDKSYTLDQLFPKFAQPPAAYVPVDAGAGAGARLETTAERTEEEQPTEAEIELADAQANFQSICTGSGLSAEEAYAQYCEIFRDGYTLEQLAPELAQPPAAYVPVDAGAGAAVGMASSPLTSIPAPTPEQVADFAEQIAEGVDPGDAALDIKGKAGLNCNTDDFADILEDALAEANRTASRGPSVTSLAGAVASGQQQLSKSPQASAEFLETYHMYIRIDVPPSDALRMANSDHGTAYTMTDIPLRTG